jgi:hypothetical protein
LSPKLKSLVEEYIDIIETSYFESALHDILDGTFDQVFKGFINASLTTPIKEEETALVP